MTQGRMLEANMRRCMVTQDDLRAKLHEANVLRQSEVRAVVLETTGDISVLHARRPTKTAPGSRTGCWRACGARLVLRGHVVGDVVARPHPVAAQQLGEPAENADQYEALREQGMGKEKAARIANADRPGKTGGKHSAYEHWTRKQLYEKARQVGLDGRSKMTKPQLKRALRSS